MMPEHIDSLVSDVLPQFSGVLGKLLSAITRKGELEAHVRRCTPNGLCIEVVRDDGAVMSLGEHLKPYTDEITQLESRIRDCQQAVPQIMSQLIPAIPADVLISLEWCHMLRERPTDAQVVSEAIRMADRLRLELQRMRAHDVARQGKDDDKGDVPASDGKRQRRGGRRKLNATETSKRTSILGEWQRAKGAGICAKDFCHDKGINVSTLKRFRDWSAKRA